jgi:hypothetical protein
MLHHPFTDWPDLLSVENETYGSYIEAFRACRRVHTHPEDFYGDPEGEGSVSDSDSADEDLQEEADKSPLADFEAFARRRPGVDFTARGDLLDSLGSREMDLSYDRSAHIGRYNEIRPEVWEQMKAKNPIELRVEVDVEMTCTLLSPLSVLYIGVVPTPSNSMQLSHSQCSTPFFNRL